ncbi:hypothetical protein C8R44DRAFT_851764 [Mycena epipterygia]|nr:hypothetical protein C8R44DRAFT_851764 [Mycena epipterygia]
MFQPFESVTEFYPGLIVWCDPNCYEMDVSTLVPGTAYDRKKSRELRPCLVITVDYNNQTFEAARLCASTPADPTRWAKIDSPPPITWKLNDAWIWVATPPTVAMVFNNAKIMHPNRDAYYSTNPVSTTNLQHYWVHRQAYMNRQMRATNVRHSTKSVSSTSYHTQPPAAGAIYSARHSPPGYSQQAPQANFFGPGSSYYQPQNHQQAAAFNTLSPHPVVVPPGFTETRQNSPGWWRNPETGWFWNASRGLLPPSPPN